ncbi:MAG: septum formation initiator family protein [Rickettsiaceae bacterium]|nr:MAG: septum formation initiator family protein [Rickettsiaceae bacterium]
MDNHHLFLRFKISRKVLLNIATLLFLFYFAFHTIYGAKGLISYFKLNKNLGKHSAELEHLRAERVENEHKVRLLKNGDKDILDEKARNILGVALPNEQVFIKNNIEDN